MDKKLTQGFREARSITRKWAKSFYFASLFLPREKRYASYAVYAICRRCDHSVDNTTESAKSQNLSDIKNKIGSVYEGVPLSQNLLLAFRQTVYKYEIPKQCFDDLIDGMYMDLNKNRYRNFEELYTYCYKAAGVVGLIMLKILGYKTKEAEDYAVSLGVAMQLTNILRDIKEDYAMGRIYLPLDELKRYGLSEDAIASGRLDGQFKDFLLYQINWAREFYKNASEGIPLIQNRRSRFVVLVMKDLYSGILRAIERNQYDVYAKRAYVSKFEKICRLVVVLFKGEYLK